MNVRHICSTEGYRYNDLPEESKRVIDGLKMLKDRVKVFEYDDEDIIRGNTIGQIKQEIAKDVIDSIVSDLELAICEVQIWLAESEAEDERCISHAVSVERFMIHLSSAGQERESTKKLTMSEN